MLKLDHFAFGSANLETDVEQMSTSLGARPIVRAKHQLFGTHNALWRLKTRMEPVYLELIAIDPQAPPPPRQRWFGLDDPRIQARFETGFKLLTFIVSTDDILGARKTMPVDPGAPVEVRRNNLKWQFSLHDDGSLVADGALPYVIEWAPGPRPVEKMACQNISLASMGGARLTELKMDFPCAIHKSKAALEVELICVRGERISFSTG